MANPKGYVKSLVLYQIRGKEKLDNPIAVRFDRETGELLRSMGKDMQQFIRDAAKEKLDRENRSPQSKSPSQLRQGDR